MLHCRAFRFQAAAALPFASSLAAVAFAFRKWLSLPSSCHRTSKMMHYYVLRFKT
jgi:hypothetical protein